MQILETNAYAKINLALCITGRRSDGYHQLDMLMQSIDLHDTLTFTAQSGLTLEVATDAAAGINTAGLPVGADNLILRAAERMQKAFHHKHTQEPLPGAHIRLVKRIPMAAGLAGGSADAAATLLALNELWQAGLGTLTLCRIGAELGADIPYCLRAIQALTAGRTTLMRAQGIGDQLTPVGGLRPCYVLIAKPPVGVETRWAYETYDTQPSPLPYDPWQIDEICDMLAHPTACAEVLSDGTTAPLYWSVLDANAFNVLQPVAAGQHPIIKELVHTLAHETASHISRMSGSGPTVFGLFSELQEAQDAAALLRKRFPALSDPSGALALCHTI